MARRSPESAFGEVLRDLRTKKGISQEALAHECERQRTYISLLERGKHSPSIATLFLLADALATKPFDWGSAASDAVMPSEITIATSRIWTLRLNILTTSLHSSPLLDQTALTAV